MTDEEKAEEYYYRDYPTTLSIGEEERKKKIKEAFMAGQLAERNREEINYGRLEKMKIKRTKKGLYRKSNFLDFVNENENAFYLVFFNLVFIVLIILLLLEK